MSRQTFPAINPATNELLADIRISTPDEIECARVEMGQAAEVWSQKLLAERARILRRFQKLLIDSADNISAVINQNCGKTRQDALIELIVTLNVLNEYIKKAPHWLRDRRVSSGIYLFKKTYTRRRPFGVVAVISPWNYPFVLSIQPMLTALLAGNTVILKPSEEAGLVGKLIEELFMQMPELAPFVRVLHGDGRVGAALVESKPDLIFLTGSVTTGQIVSRAAAQHLIPTLTELGGKDPMIVLEDADIEAAAEWGVWGACFNSGQTCMAVERIYVVEKVYDQFLHHLLRHAKKFKMGFTTDTESPYSMGPLTIDRQVDVVERHIEDALAKGAKVLVGGKREGRFMPPTALVDVTHDMLLMQEETFGPLIPVMKVRDEAEAIRWANDSQFGLGASVWSGNSKRAQRTLDRIEAGALQVNDAISHFGVPQLPFGGVKKSGSGRVHCKEDLLQFTQTYAYAVSKPPHRFDVVTILRRPGHYRLGMAMMKLLFGVGGRQRLSAVQELANTPFVRSRLKQALGMVGMIGVALKTFRARR